MFDLTGRTALVTGASGGIGAAVARALHARGARLVVTGRRPEPLAALADELGGGGVTVHACDVADAGAAEALVKAADAAAAEGGGGGLDILVNNAGVTRDNLALRLKDEEWEEVLRTNLTAAFRLCRAALRGMMRRRFGRIVNVTSVVAVTGNPGQANYAAAKAGLIGMTKALAAEVAGRGVTVNCVAPGFVATAMTDALDEAQRARILERVPAGRLGAPDDVAAGVVYLAAPEAGYVTGQTLHINGGLAMV